MSSSLSFRFRQSILIQAGFGNRARLTGGSQNKAEKGYFLFPDDYESQRTRKMI